MLAMSEHYMRTHTHTWLLVCGRAVQVCVHTLLPMSVLYLLDLVLGSSYVLDRGPWARLEPVNLGSGTRLGYSKLAL